jgi:hypothetical protein
MRSILWAARHEPTMSLGKMALETVNAEGGRIVVFDVHSSSAQGCLDNGKNLE